MTTTMTFRLTFLFTVAMACAASTCCLGQVSPFIQQLENGQQQTVVVYGTSLTAGGAWVSQISSQLNQQYPGQITWINSGLSGKASNSGVANLQTKVLDHQPDAVFIEFAMNDAFTAYDDGNIDQNISVEQARANLESMISSIGVQNSAAQVILQTMNPAWDAPNGNLSGTKRPYLADYYQMYRDVADDQGLTLVDNNRVWTMLQTQDTSEFAARVADGTHPDALGYQRYVTGDILYQLGASLGPCLLLDTQTGAATLHNQSNDNAAIISYTISSATGALLTDWTGLATNEPEVWQKARPTTQNLSELTMTADYLTMAPGESIDLGTVWDTQKSPNLQFKYQTTDGVVHNSYVVFLNATGTSEPLTGDFNGDGIVDLSDYTVWRNHLGATGSNLAADSDANGVVDQADYLAWKTNFGATAPSAMQTSSTQVPEPGTAVLILMSALATSTTLKTSAGSFLPR